MSDTEHEKLDTLMTTLEVVEKYMGQLKPLPLRRLRRIVSSSSSRYLKAKLRRMKETMQGCRTIEGKVNMQKKIDLYSVALLLRTLSLKGLLDDGIIYPNSLGTPKEEKQETERSGD